MNYNRDLESRIMRHYQSNTAHQQKYSIVILGSCLSYQAIYVTVKLDLDQVSFCDLALSPAI